MPTANKPPSFSGEESVLPAALVKADAFLSAVLKPCLIAFGLGLPFLMVAQVVMRYWLELPFLGIEEVSVLLGLWLYFLGAAYATRLDAHIKGGIADVVLRTERTRRAVRFLGSVICLVASGVFVKFAADYAAFVLSTNRTSTYLHWHTGIWVASMLAGFVLIILYLTLQAVRQWRLWKGSVQQND